MEALIKLLKLNSGKHTNLLTTTVEISIDLLFPHFTRSARFEKNPKIQSCLSRG